MRRTCLSIVALVVVGATACAPSTHPDELFVPGHPLPIKSPTSASNADLVPIDWTLGRVTHNDRRVHISVNQSACHPRLDHVEVEEWSSRVVIRALAVKMAPPTGPCLLALIYRVGYVELRDPVGGRPIVGGAETY